MADKKIFVGSGKKRKDNWLSITINPDKLAEHIKEYNGNKFVKLNINVGEPDKYGKDVQVTIDTWEPEAKDKTFVKNEPNDLPF